MRIFLNEIVMLVKRVLFDFNLVFFEFLLFSCFVFYKLVIKGFLIVRKGRDVNNINKELK